MKQRTTMWNVTEIHAIILECDEPKKVTLQPAGMSHAKI